MKKSFMLALIICIVSPNLFAETPKFSYVCKSLKSVVFDDTLQVDIYENYQVVVLILDLPYTGQGTAMPRTIKGKEFMSVQLVSTPGSSEYQLDEEPLIMEKELFTGGYKLKKGGQGGFVKFVGQGYAYENFLCESI